MFESITNKCMFQAVNFNQRLCERMIHGQDPDTPSGLISPPPGGQVEVKDEPEDEDVPEPPEIVMDDDDEDSIHDNDEAMEELTAEVNHLSRISHIDVTMKQAFPDTIFILYTGQLSLI